MPLPRIQTAIVQKLLEMERISQEQADRLFDAPDEITGDQMEKILREEFKVSDFQLLAARARAFELYPIHVKHVKLNDRTFERLDKDFCRENKLLPIGVAGDHIIVAIGDPFNLGIANRISELTKLKVTILLGVEKDIQGYLEEKNQPQQTAVGFGDVMADLNVAFGTEEGKELSEDDLEEESAPIIQLSSRIIEDAYFSGGSDIHIEPFETHARVRVRVDGILQEKLNIPVKVCNALMARLKVMANLDIAEKRLPQDGRIVFKQFNKKGLDVDLRVATAPLNHGEGCVMRILDKQKSTLPLTALGYSPDNLTLYRDLIQRPYGMILHCGPTGSGKSMTLYSALNEINTPDICIRTAEDPIEYTLPGLLQMQMQRKIGLTFSSALRAFLRQDPDVILVGEIRDPETAQIAVEAALTGHMLFSTLHTNDAPGTISRLTEMDIEPFMISASLLCVCAQRLLRRVCKTCKQPYTPEGREATLLERALGWQGQIFRANPSGCPVCNGNGYKGRVGTHELMAISEELVKGINQAMETAKLKRIAIRNGMKTLHQDSLLKVRDGVTTVQEAIANIPPDMEDIEKILTAANLEMALAD
ncbi:MAG: ATPase, T2SS/T4P/T4SS family [Verrucomicrobiota bacterium]|nr:ATPase, T2SS/T4P/T4SS family [Verrucomicrobiota bacterium]